MPARRILSVLVLLSVPLLALWNPAKSAMGIPTSVALVYPKAKIFKPGDWVLYEVRGQSLQGDSSVDYQRIQIGVTLAYRGEDCFWLETGWGHARERLEWSAAMVSEGMFGDTLAEARPRIYVRKLQMEIDDNGIPRSYDVRTIDPSNPLPEIPAFRPEYKEAGTDTLQTAKGRIVCQIVDVTFSSNSSRDMADSTMQSRTETRSRRWMNPKVVPITGIVREEETKVYTMRVWPVGKPSTDFPPHVTGTDRHQIEVLDFGHGAKPMISDRIRDSQDRTPVGGSK
jgi:hypothetical protein